MTRCSIRKVEGKVRLKQANDLKYKKLLCMLHEAFC